MTDARLAREATVVLHHLDDADARLAREAAVVLHHFPEANTAARLGRHGVVVLISWPHGYGVFKDNATP